MIGAQYWTCDCCGEQVPVDVGHRCTVPMADCPSPEEIQKRKGRTKSRLVVSRKRRNKVPEWQRPRDRRR
jgi:hypothetical protein